MISHQNAPRLGSLPISTPFSGGGSSGRGCGCPGSKAEPGPGTATVPAWLSWLDWSIWICTWIECVFIYIHICIHICIYNPNCELRTLSHFVSRIFTNGFIDGGMIGGTSIEWFGVTGASGA